MAKDGPTNFLTVPEVAAILQVNAETVRALIKADVIKAADARRPGSKRPSYRIRPEALEEFESNRPAATPKPAKRRRRKKTDGQIIQFYK